MLALFSPEHFVTCHYTTFNADINIILPTNAPFI